MTIFSNETSIGNRLTQTRVLNYVFASQICFNGLTKGAETREFPDEAWLDASLTPGGSWERFIG